MYILEMIFTVFHRRKVVKNLAKESMKLIEEAEAAAYDAEIHAQAQASEIVSEAKQRAISAHAEALARAKEMVDITKTHAAEIAENLQKSTAQECMAASEKLKAQAAEKLSTAVDIVIADIIN